MAGDGTMGQDGPSAGGGSPSRPVALVTGGARGIGLGCAMRLKQAGHQVAITYNTTPPEAAGDLLTDVLAVRCDVRDPLQVDEAFATIEAKLGNVEVLVANAGIVKDTLLLRMGEEAWADVLETNLSGTYRVVKRALGPMVRARRGRVILVSSVVAFLGSPGQVNYAASKAGLVGMARSLAREVASRQITVNVVAPGVVETDMIANLGEERAGELRAMVPLGRATTPAEVGGVVAFLASDDAAYLTGVVLPVDGGMAMGL
jgi:3-oxoacyl-[acyl-carrier protein] reductase